MPGIRWSKSEAGQKTTSGFFFGNLVFGARVSGKKKEMAKEHHLHPGRLTWNIIMEVWFRSFSF